MRMCNHQVILMLLGKGLIRSAPDEPGELVHLGARAGRSSAPPLPEIFTAVYTPTTNCADLALEPVIRIDSLRKNHACQADYVMKGGK